MPAGAATIATCAACWTANLPTEVDAQRDRITLGKLRDMNPYVIPWMDDDLEVFRDTVVRFIDTEMVPHDARWREQHHVDRETWRKAGDTGLLLLDVPAEYGGGGGDFRHEAVLYTELGR